MINYVHVIFLMSTLFCFINSEVPDVNLNVMLLKAEETTGEIRTRDSSKNLPATVFASTSNFTDKNNNMELPNSTFFNVDEHKNSTDSMFSSFFSNLVKRKCSTHIPTYYMTLLIALDDSFIEYHKDMDYKTYILTIMNMAADHFQDSTLGVEIKLIVSKIYIMGEESKPFRNNNYMQMSESFCKWSRDFKKFYPDYDVAVLITRYQFANTSNATFGATFPGSICDIDRSCIVMQDTGLMMGVQITRLLGRLLGLQIDDGTAARCPPKAKSSINMTLHHIMAPHLQFSQLAWSVCSRIAVRMLFSSGGGWCLMDKPSKILYKYPNMLPGVMYDLDFQCYLSHRGTKAQISESMDLCTNVICADSTNHFNITIKPAQGSPCGTDKWCFNGDCVHIGFRPGAINGQWSEWLPWDPCSRTCGGGVQVSRRYCDNPPPAFGGSPCFGSPFRARTCNIMECDVSDPCFREVQCAKFNTVVINGTFNKWRPLHLYIEGDRCGLYCLNEKDKLARLMPTVQDGTTCRINTKDRCIDGICMSVGCDWKVDSDTIEDRCGVCGGDGSSCERVHGWVNATGSKMINITLLLTIPANSRFIELYQTVPSNKRFMFQFAASNNLLKERFVNTLFAKDTFPKMFYVGTTRNKRIKAVMKGPTKYDINVYVESGDNVVPVHYSYMVPRKKSKFMSLRKILPFTNTLISSANFFEWQYLGWTKCSARCEGGAQITIQKCVSIWFGEVSNYYCNFSKKLVVMSRVCNLRTCYIRWRVGPWFNIIGYNNAIQMRHTYCMKESPSYDQSEIFVSSDFCKSIKRPQRLRLYSNLNDDQNEEAKGKLIFYHARKNKIKNLEQPQKNEETKLNDQRIIMDLKDKIVVELNPKTETQQQPSTPTCLDNKTKLSGKKANLDLKGKIVVKIHPKIATHHQSHPPTCLNNKSKLYPHETNSDKMVVKINSKNATHKQPGKPVCVNNKPKINGKIANTKLKGNMVVKIQSKTTTQQQHDAPVCINNKTSLNGQKTNTNLREKMIVKIHSTNATHQQPGIPISLNKKAELNCQKDNSGHKYKMIVRVYSKNETHTKPGTMTKTMVLPEVSINYPGNNKKRKRHVSFSFKDFPMRYLPSLKKKNKEEKYVKKKFVQNFSMYRIKDIKKTLYITEQKPEAKSKYYLVFSLDAPCGSILNQNFNEISVGLWIGKYFYNIENKINSQAIAQRVFEKALNFMVGKEDASKKIKHLSKFKKLFAKLKNKKQKDQKYKNGRYRRLYNKIKNDIYSPNIKNNIEKREQTSMIMAPLKYSDTPNNETPNKIMEFTKNDESIYAETIEGWTTEYYLQTPEFGYITASNNNESLNGLDYKDECSNNKTQGLIETSSHKIYNIESLNPMEVQKTFPVNKEKLPYNTSIRFSFTIDTKNLQHETKTKGKHKCKTIEKLPKRTKNINYYDIQHVKDTFYVEPYFRSNRDMFLIVNLDCKAYRKLCKVLKPQMEILFGNETLKFKFLRKPVSSSSLKDCKCIG